MLALFSARMSVGEPLTTGAAIAVEWRCEKTIIASTPSMTSPKIVNKIRLNIATRAKMKRLVDGENVIGPVVRAEDSCPTGNLESSAGQRRKASGSVC